MIETLISSKTRIKLLLKFFLNSDTTAYLRSLESEFGESTNAIRLELNNLEKAGMLTSFNQGNRKYFRANTLHPLYREIHNILLKHLGIDRIIANVIESLGNVQQVYLTGDFSKGIDSQVIDLLIVGDVDRGYLANLSVKAEELIRRKIRYIVYSDSEFSGFDLKKEHPQPLLLWSQES